MKKKILAIALVVAMLAVAIVSASLAYFTDEDYATNTFTLGEVDIDLEEEFEQDSEIFPGVDVTKKVWVENTSETGNEAYVRVHVAFPRELAPRKWVGAVGTEGQDGYVAAHYEYDINGTAGLAIVTANSTDWTWTDIYSADIGEEDTVDGEGNPVEGTIVPCVVYVATYNNALPAVDNAATTDVDETATTPAITAVRLNEEADTDIIDGKLHLFMDDNEDGEWDVGELRVNAQDTTPFTIEIEVAAEAVQVEGMKAIDGNTDVNGNDKAIAADALDTAFGVPGEYTLSDAGEGENKINWVNHKPHFNADASYTVAP